MVTSVPQFRRKAVRGKCTVTETDLACNPARSQSKGSVAVISFPAGTPIKPWNVDGRRPCLPPRQIAAAWHDPKLGWVQVSHRSPKNVDGHMLCTPRAPLLLTRILPVASKVGIGLAWRPGSKFASRDECSEKIY